MANDIKIALEGVDGVFIESETVSQIYLNEVPLLGDAIIDDPPIYLMTEPLVNDGSFDYLFNSASSGSKWDAKLLTSGDIAWNPTVQEYPEDGTIDFGTNYGDTQWTPPADEEYTFTFIENVDMGTSYDMVSINPKGDGLTADVLYDGVLTAENTGLLYTPPTESVKLRDNMSETIVPMIPNCLSLTLSQYAFEAGDTATITMEFGTVSANELTNFFIEADNGTVTNMTRDTDRPWIWTALFTPDADVADDTNTMTFVGALGDVVDAWGNFSDAQTVSANYTVNTGAVAQPYTVYYNFDDGTNTPAGITVNTITNGANFTGNPADALDTDGNTTGVSLEQIVSSNDGYNIGDPTHATCFGDGDFAEVCYAAGYNNPDQRIDITLPEGTFTVTAFSSRSSGGTNRKGEFTIEGDMQVLDAYAGPHCAEWVGLDGGRTVPFYWEGQDSTVGVAYLCAIKIESTVGGTPPDPTEVYISFNDSGTSLPPPSGYTVNQVLGYRDLTTVHSLVDKDNIASQVTIQSLYECQSIASTGNITGDDSGCMSDTQIRDYWGISYGLTRDTAEFSIYLPAGTWSLQFGSSRDTTDTNRTMDVTFDGVTKQVDGANDVPNNCALWEGFVSAGEYVNVLCTMPDTSLYGQINGITLMGELT